MQWSMPERSLPTKTTMRAGGHEREVTLRFLREGEGVVSEQDRARVPGYTNHPLLQQACQQLPRNAPGQKRKILHAGLHRSLCEHAITPPLPFTRMTRPDAAAPLPGRRGRQLEMPESTVGGSRREVGAERGPGYSKSPRCDNRDAHIEGGRHSGILELQGGGGGGLKRAASFEICFIDCSLLSQSTRACRGLWHRDSQPVITCVMTAAYLWGPRKSKRERNPPRRPCQFQPCLLACSPFSASHTHKKRRKHKAQEGGAAARTVYASKPK